MINYLNVVIISLINTNGCHNDHRGGRSDGHHGGRSDRDDPLSCRYIRASECTLVL